MDTPETSMYDMYALIYKTDTQYCIKFGYSENNWIKIYHTHILKENKGELVSLLMYFYISTSLEHVSIYTMLLINEFKLKGFSIKKLSHETIVIDRCEFSENDVIIKYVKKIIRKTKPKLSKSVYYFSRNKPNFEANHKVNYRTAISCDMSKFYIDNRKRPRQDDEIDVTRTSVIIKNGHLKIIPFEDTMQFRYDSINNAWHYYYTITIDYMNTNNKNMPRSDSENAYSWLQANIRDYNDGKLPSDKTELFKILYDTRQLLKPKHLQY